MNEMNADTVFSGRVPPFQYPVHPPKANIKGTKMWKEFGIEFRKFEAVQFEVRVGHKVRQSRETMANVGRIKVIG